MPQSTEGQNEIVEKNVQNQFSFTRRLFVEEMCRKCRQSRNDKFKGIMAPYKSAVETALAVYISPDDHKGAKLLSNIVNTNDTNNVEKFRKAMKDMVEAYKNWPKPDYKDKWHFSDKSTYDQLCYEYSSSILRTYDLNPPVEIDKSNGCIPGTLEFYLGYWLLTRGDATARTTKMMQKFQPYWKPLNYHILCVTFSMLAYNKSGAELFLEIIENNGYKDCSAYHSKYVHERLPINRTALEIKDGKPVYPDDTTVVPIQEVSSNLENPNQSFGFSTSSDL